MTKKDLYELLPKTFEKIPSESLPPDCRITYGKVRDIIDLGESLVIVTTDRISAFDRVLTTIPVKGAVLNRLAMFWFEKTDDIIENHILRCLSQRTVVVKKCAVLPVEVVVRGYITGSAWRDYSSGRSIPGTYFPPGMRMNQKLPSPVITPTTKAERGEHDRPIHPDDIIAQKLVPEKVWREVEEKALSLFARGTGIAASNGLILVDTKYEFGLDNGKIILIDEIHTPDSSRYWIAETYEELFERGEKQRKVDKEYLRQWLLDRGFSGHTDPPHIPDDIRVEVAKRYIRAFETVTGEEFLYESVPPAEEIAVIKKELNL